MHIIIINIFYIININIVISIVIIKPVIIVRKLNVKNIYMSINIVSS